MTLKVMISNGAGSGRRLDFMVRKCFTDDHDDEIVTAFQSKFGLRSAREAKRWSFSYANPDWEYIVTMLPAFVEQTIDLIAHDMPTAPKRFVYFSSFSVDYHR